MTENQSQKESKEAKSKRIHRHLAQRRRSAAGGQRSWPTVRWTGLLGVMTLEKEPRRNIMR